MINTDIKSIEESIQSLQVKVNSKPSINSLLSGNKTIAGEWDFTGDQTFKNELAKNTLIPKLYHKVCISTDNCVIDDEDYATDYVIGETVYGKQITLQDIKALFIYIEKKVGTPDFFVNRYSNIFADLNGTNINESSLISSTTGYSVIGAVDTLTDPGVYIYQRGPILQGSNNVTHGFSNIPSYIQLGYFPADA